MAIITILNFHYCEGHKEQLPMVLKVPRIIRSDILVCQRDYSLLGFGDILVPGNEEALESESTCMYCVVTLCF